MNKQNDSLRSNSTSSSPEAISNRLGPLRHRLSIQIKKMIDEDKLETEQNEKQAMKKSKVYTNLQQVQKMKDAKSQNGFLNQYEQDKKLGEGCHSSVYKCINKKQNKPYAVKILKQKDMELLQNVRQSYRILKKLQHQNIVQAKNLFINQKYMTCHLVLEYCEWEDLDLHMRNGYQFNKKEIAEIVSQLLKTVAYIHHQGICHRDLKPDNILYSQKKNKIKVIDFEVARIKKYTNQRFQLMTKTGILSYRAPEIFDSIYDQKIDIWSVGVLAYLLLTGNLPFTAEYQQDLIKKILKQQPNYDGLSVWQQQFLQRLLCKNPQKRATANQALSSPFLFIHSKVSQSPPTRPHGMVKSPSLGRQQFEQSILKNKNISNKFYDDDVANMFLGNNQGDIGVIRWEEENANFNDDEDEDDY